MIGREIGNRLADRIIRGEVRTGDTTVVRVNEGGEGLSIRTVGEEEEGGVNARPVANV